MFLGIIANNHKASTIVIGFDRYRPALWPENKVIFTHQSSIIYLTKLEKSHQPNKPRHIFSGFLWI